MSFRGQSLRRLEDARFLTGRGRYIEDIDVPGQTWMQVVRSPHAHATIERIDIEAARGVSGVLGVFTAADLAELGPLPCTVPVASVAPMIVPPRPTLASGRARHRGTRRGGLAVSSRRCRRSGGVAVGRATVVAAGAEQPVLSLPEG
jgi:carbon-monoxide dehydrogenase large subunit